MVTPPAAIAGQTVVLRPTTATHVPRFLEIVSDAEVAKWWGGYDLERVRRELSGPQSFAVELHGEVVGLIIYYEEDDPDHRHAGIDLALHPDAHGRGLGADAMRTMARHLFEVRGHHRIVIDPAAHNERAIRSYSRVGFRPVGVMRRLRAPTRRQLARRPAHGPAARRPRLTPAREWPPQRRRRAMITGSARFRPDPTGNAPIRRS